MTSTKAITAKTETRQEDPNQPILIVGVGASAGGLTAFTELVSSIPSDTDIAFILMPHLDPQHKSMMKDLLKDQTIMPVNEVNEAMEIVANQIYILPPGKGAVISNGELQLVELELPAYRWTVVDQFFRTLAGDQKERAVGIILSGTGSHGSVGIGEIKQAGGLVIAQAPETCQYPQMPVNAIESGMVDLVLPPTDMPAALLEYSQHPYLGLGEKFKEIPPDQINPILNILRSRTRFDFRDYRKNMLIRRIQRRMSLCHLDSLTEYEQYLRDTASEVTSLNKDLLIGVTSFFRDPEAFHVLNQRVIKTLVERNKEETPIRVWVPACSTGEEAYSLGMLFLEAFESAKKIPNLQIFATDIDEEALAIARQGVYPDNIINDLSERHIKQFFVKTADGKYQVSKRLRDNLVFASQSVISDAPFSHLDLISCRNMLIYLLPLTQSKVISLFHFALNYQGYLFLGPSESIGRQTELFEVLSKKWRLFQRTPTGKRKLLDVSLGGPPLQKLSASNTVNEMPYQDIHTNFSELTLTTLLKDYAPASVLVNRNYQILQFFGPTIDYLNLPNGAPTLELMSMLRQGLSSRVRAIAHRVWRDQTKVVDTKARVKRDNNYVHCVLTARPVLGRGDSEKLMLISFEDLETESVIQREKLLDDEPNEELKVVEQLEYELKATREDLQSNLEELESSNEELKAANEEMTSMNEELQSANEELETSKEELQSMNEELNTVNSELQAKVEELETSHDDVNNLLASTDIATIFLDRSMHIKLFNPPTAELLNLRNTDIDRPISDFNGRVENVHFQLDIKHVLDKLTSVERVVSSTVDQDQATYLRRVVPYRASNDRIGGVVVTFVDITERYQQEKLLEQRVEERTQALNQINEKLSLVLSAAGAAVWEIDEFKNRGMLWDETSKNMFGEPPVDLKDTGDWWLQRIHPNERQGVSDSLNQAISGEATHWEKRYRFKMDGGNYHWISDIAHIIRDEASGHLYIIGALVDINQRKLTENALKEREKRLAATMNSAAEGMIVMDDHGSITESNFASERMFGYTRKELVGKNFTELLPALTETSDKADKVFSLVQAYKTFRPPQGIYGLRKDGSTFPLETTVTEVEQFGLFVAVVRDLSAQRRLEKEVALISTREQEKTGRELHDGLGQRLTGLKLLATHAKNRVAQHDLPDIELMTDMIKQLDEAADEVRWISHGLAPISVRPDGLVDAIATLISSVKVSRKIACRFENHSDICIKNAAAANQIYRIAQEAFNNALKYSDATHITITIEEVNKSVELCIIDDGAGFDIDKVMQLDGFGLRIMHYRANSVGAMLDIDSKLGKGTRVCCTYRHVNQINGA